MGGCCCCPKKGAELNAAPAYYYYPRAPEEHVPLSSHHVAASIVSTGLLVDTNLDTSVPDAYQPPPLPIPFETAAPGRPETPRRPPNVTPGKDEGAVPTTDSGPAQQTTGANLGETPVKCDLLISDCKVEIDLEIDPVKEKELELSKSIETLVSATEEEEDVCPTCLEEYDKENPKITTKCEHHFHLACIFEWMERSDTCPVCDKVMVIDPPID